MRRTRRKWLVFLYIFIAAAICVTAIAGVIYFIGYRYIKSEADIKFFGKVDKTGDILEGRIWGKDSAGKVRPQKYYIAESPDGSAALPEQNSGAEFTVENFRDFIFDFGKTKGVSFRSETFEVLLKDYENAGNYIINAEIFAFEENGSSKTVWVLSPAASSLSSYKHYDVVRESDKTKKYDGDILDFIKNERVYFASVQLKNGNKINLYAVSENIYRIDYDEGVCAGDVYIGALSKNFEKSGGKELYFFGRTGDIYLGNFEGDKRGGFGEFISGNGDIYTGNMLDGKKHGKGVFTWADGSSYDGEFADNMKNGYGVNTFSDGSVYEGEYVNDVKHGKGKYKWANGDIYEGDFANDQYKGKGKYTWALPDGGFEEYEGDFDHNTIHGEGTYSWISGRKYTGYFSYGVMVREKPEE